MAADLRGTGYPDLFIANDYGVSELFVNEGGRFREVGRETGVGYAPKSGMNASVGDVLNQGRFAIYVSNISEEGILLQGNNLWVPDRRARTACRSYENLATRDGRRPRRLELRRAVRRPQQRRLPRPLPGQRLRLGLDRNESYWYDYSKVAGGHEVVISDAKNWPPMGTRSLAGYQQKKVWINDGAGPLHRRGARWSA